MYIKIKSFLTVISSVPCLRSCAQVIVVLGKACKSKCQDVHAFEDATGLQELCVVGGASVS